jgi:hypothetical protein
MDEELTPPPPRTIADGSPIYSPLPESPTYNAEDSPRASGALFFFDAPVLLPVHHVPYVMPPITIGEQPENPLPAEERSHILRFTQRSSRHLRSNTYRVFIPNFSEICHITLYDRLPPHALIPILVQRHVRDRVSYTFELFRETYYCIIDEGGYFNNNRIQSGDHWTLTQNAVDGQERMLDFECEDGNAAFRFVSLN